MPERVEGWWGHGRTHHQPDRTGVPAARRAPGRLRAQSVADMRAQVPAAPAARRPATGRAGHRLERRLRAGGHPRRTGPARHPRRRHRLRAGARPPDRDRRLVPHDRHRRARRRAGQRLHVRQRRRVRRHHQGRGARPDRQAVRRARLPDLQRRRAAPGRPAHRQTYQSVIKPLGAAHTTRTLEFDADGTPVLREITVEPASRGGGRRDRRRSWAARTGPAGSPR